MLHAGELSTYRGVQLGMNLPTAARQAGTNASEARTVHQRPALIQEMDWPRIAGDLARTGSVSSGLLSFFNGDLFRIVITYDRFKIEGMTPDDIIESISATYGPATRPTEEVAYHSIYSESVPVIARWENSEYAYSLVRTADRSSFALIICSKRLDALAQAAITEAVRIEAQEAPQRELEKQKKRDEDERLLLEKARAINKPNFRP